MLRRRTIEDESKIKYFEPERFDIHVNYASLIRRATINVSTSLDVVRVTYDGTEMTGGVAGNYNSFSSEQLNGISEGTTWEIIGYNADGIPTVPHTAVAGG